MQNGIKVFKNKEIYNILIIIIVLYKNLWKNTIKITFILKKKYINIKLKDNYIKYLIILQVYSVFYINYKVINKKFD